MTEKHTYPHDDASGKLPEGLRANPYTVPNGYFESLLQQTIQQCHSSIPANEGDLPAGYFEQLTENITAKIAEQKLKTFVNEPGFVIPDGYFYGLEQRLVAGSKLKESVTETGFTVPEHYFEHLSDRIREATKKQTTPVRKLRWSKWVAYAAAASVALVLGISFFNVVSPPVEPPQPLAAVSDQQILDYLELYGSPDDLMYISEELEDFDEQNIGAGVSDEEIEAYLNHIL